MRLEKAAIESVQNGRAVRRLNVFLCALFLTLVLGLLMFFGASGILVIAVTAAAASLCVVWALMSVSASINAHLDCLAAMVVYYGERKSQVHTSP
jgi:hypothetical protein